MTIHKPYLVVSSNMADLDFYQDDSDENADDGYGFDRGIGDVDELTPLQKLEKYLVCDNMFNRQMLARSLLDTLRAVHDQDDDCMAVLESMAKLSEDPEPSVRSELMEQVPHIAVYCQENRAFASAVPKYILPMVVRYLNDSNSQVRKTSQAALLVLMEQSLVERIDVESQVVNVILELAAPASSDDYRSEAAALMSKMAPLLGKSITERHFLPRFSEMCTDPLFHVRKVCAANFGEVSNVVGVQNCEEVLLPRFFLLCEDSVWGVRKACAECFMTVSCACSLETRRNELANLFVNLLCDQSRWVRMSAFQHLGPFISTFADAADSGFYVNENGNLTVETLESFSIEEYESHEHQGSNADDQNNLQGILQLKSLDLPGTLTESDTDTDSSSSPEKENLDILSERLDEAMELLEDDFGPIDLENDIPETSLEELRALSLSDKSGSGGDYDDSIANGTGQAGDTGVVALSLICDMDSQEVGGSSPSKSQDRGDLVSVDVKSDSPSSDQSPADAGVLGNEDQSILSPTSEANDIAGNDEAAQSSVLDCTNSNTTTETVIPKPSDSSDIDVPTQEDTTFNHFQYWRPPLPEVSIDFDQINSKPSDIHAVSKRKDGLFDLSESNTNISSSSSFSHSSVDNVGLSSSSLFSTSGSGSHSTIHTASVNTMNDTAEETMNIGSTHVLGQHFGEHHFAVVDGIVQDLSTSNIGFMDDLPSLLDMVFDDATLAQQQNIVPQLLLENYLGMVDPTRAQTVDGDITRHCAYNLPAVAYTLGRRNWHCIKQLYETLAQDMQWKVRRTLAFSIHELALIVGDEITHKDLVPIFDGFLKDLDEVRIGVLKHLAEIFKILRPNVRILYLSRVQDFMKTDNTRNWRFREELAEQLICICDLFHCREIVDHVVPLSLVLCMDKVAQVRTMALRLLSSILRRTYFDDEKKLLASICNDLIEKFATNNRWLGRQTFAQLCYVILEEDSLPPEVFARNLLPSLLALSTDPVANVRLCLARVLSERITPLDYFTSQSNPHHSDLVETLHKLTMDVDKDVRYFSCHQQSKTDLSQHHQTVPV